MRGVQVSAPNFLAALPAFFSTASGLWALLAEWILTSTTDVLSKMVCRYTRTGVMPVSCCRKRISTAMRIGRYTRGSRASAHDTRLLWNTKLLLRAMPGSPALATLSWHSCSRRDLLFPLPREAQPREPA